MQPGPMSSPLHRFWACPEWDLNTHQLEHEVKNDCLYFKPLFPALLPEALVSRTRLRLLPYALVSRDVWCIEKLFWFEVSNRIDHWCISNRSSDVSITHCCIDAASMHGFRTSAYISRLCVVASVRAIYIKHPSSSSYCQPPSIFFGQYFGWVGALRSGLTFEAIAPANGPLLVRYSETWLHCFRIVKHDKHTKFYSRQTN